jgi:hypothetical protein
MMDAGCCWMIAEGLCVVRESGGRDVHLIPKGRPLDVIPEHGHLDFELASSDLHVEVYYRVSFGGIERFEPYSFTSASLS